MKEFISRQVDVIRPSYGRKALDYPRAFTFAATTNTQNFLNDATGSRRYVVIKVNKEIDTNWVKANRDQIWAQIKDDDSLNLYGYIPSKLVQAHLEANKDFQYIDSETEAILDFIAILSDEDRQRSVISFETLNTFFKENKLPPEDYQKLKQVNNLVLLNPFLEKIKIYHSPSLQHMRASPLSKSPYQT